MRRAGLRDSVVLLGYAAVSFLYFGVHLVAHPERWILGFGQDPQIFVWSFAWWEHAIATGTNPFVSHAVYAPHGINLAWATTVPGLAVPFAPLTALVGPVASYNVAALLMPALSAWTAFRLCHYLTRAAWPSLVGGYLFGFSAYVLGQELGHLHMTSVFLLPLVALVILRYVRGENGRRRVTWQLGLLLAWQFWLSSEVFFTLTLALAVAFVLAAALGREVRPRLRSLVRPLAYGYALAAVLAAPLVVYTISGFQTGSLNTPGAFDADLLNFVVPTHIVALTTARLTQISTHFEPNDAEADAYLGIPTLAIAAWYAIDRRGSAGARFLLTALVVAALASLGTSLRIEGESKVRLPWHWLAKLPLFDNALPVRISVYTTLAAAVVVALWAHSHPSWYGVALSALAALALVPAIWRVDYRNEPVRWPFFTQGTYKLCLHRNEEVAIFPYGFRGDSMLWQAETGFWFRMAEGALLPKPPEPLISDPLVQKLTFTYGNPTPSELVAFVNREHVNRVISVIVDTFPGGLGMRRLGPPQWVGGVIVSPACGYPARPG